MVVEGYLEGGAPVGSKALSAEVQWGPSTIRHELASLEDAGLLAHPHTPGGPGLAHTGHPTPAAVAVPRRPRARRGNARDHRDALAGHEPAGDRHRPTDPDVD